MNPSRVTTDMSSFVYYTSNKQRQRGSNLNTTLLIYRRLCTMLATNNDKEVALTRNEQQVYIELMKKRVTTTKEIDKITNNYETSRTVLSRLVRKGYAIRAHRGYYSAVPPELIGTNYEVDRYILAYKVGRTKGILSHHTALELHGVAQSYFNTVFISRKTPLRTFDFQGVEYRFLRQSWSFGVVSILRDSVKVELTDRERTILDCIRNPDYCGGLEELIKSISAFHQIDVSVLETYLKKYGERSLTIKTGYLLSMMKEELRIPDGLLEKLKAQKKDKVYYLTPQAMNGEGQMVKEWNLIVPKNMEEVMRFA